MSRLYVSTYVYTKLKCLLRYLLLVGGVIPKDIHTGKHAPAFTFKLTV